MDLLYVLFLLVPAGATPSGGSTTYKWEGQPMTFETKQQCEEVGAGLATATIRISNRTNNSMIDKSIAGTYCQKRKTQ